MLPVSSHDRILMAAKRLFAYNGYENTSTVAIAREAGTSESQLMKHFGSKRGLLAVILDRAWTDIAQRVQMLPNGNSPADRLFSALETIIIALESDPDLKNLLLLETRRVRKDNRDVFVSQSFQQFANTISAILGEMRDQGQLSPHLNLEAVRAAFVGMTEGLLRDRILAQRSEFQADYSLEDVRKVLGVLVSSLATQASHQTLKVVND